MFLCFSCFEVKIICIFLLMSIFFQINCLSLTGTGENTGGTGLDSCWSQNSHRLMTQKAFLRNCLVYHGNDVVLLHYNQKMYINGQKAEDFQVRDSWVSAKFLSPCLLSFRSEVKRSKRAYIRISNTTVVGQKTEFSY